MSIDSTQISSLFLDRIDAFFQLNNFPPTELLRQFLKDRMVSQEIIDKLIANYEDIKRCGFLAEELEEKSFISCLSIAISSGTLEIFLHNLLETVNTEKIDFEKAVKLFHE